MNGKPLRVKEIDVATYARFLQAQGSAATPFHSAYWINSVQDGFRVRTRLLGVFDKDSLFAVCPFSDRRLGPVHLIGSPLPRTFTPYQGAVWSPDTTDSLRLQSLASLVKYLSSPYVRMQWSPWVTPIEQARMIPAYTPIINLELGGEELFRKMKADTRNQVRQAFRRGVEIRQVAELGEWVDDYLSLSGLTYERQGLATSMTSKFLETLFSGTKDATGRQNASAVVFLASAAQKVIAASLAIYDKDTAYFVDNVSDRRFQSYRPNNALVWSMIEWATQSNIKRLDLVGANVPSIAAFKLGFGAERCSFPTYTHYSRLGFLLYGGYRVTRKAIQVMRRARLTADGPKVGGI